VGLRVRDLEQNNAELGGWCVARPPCAPERLIPCAAPPKAPDAGCGEQDGKRKAAQVSELGELI
jgi:hypothetical protein